MILITQSPYSTEHAYGAIAFAVACAHQGILTRVIFLEDGVYALKGDQKFCPDSVGFNIQNHINAVAGNENLHLFALTPSFQKRGVTKNKTLKAVLEIGYPGLGKILFYIRECPRGSPACADILRTFRDSGFWHGTSCGIRQHIDRRCLDTCNNLHAGNKSHLRA